MSVSDSEALGCDRSTDRRDYLGRIRSEEETRLDMDDRLVLEVCYVAGLVSLKDVLRTAHCFVTRPGTMLSSE